MKLAYALLQSSPKYRATLRDVDVLLDELARLCRFSQLPSSPSDSPAARSQLAILTDLYSLASPDDTAIITQIILKDLRPLLHPLEFIHTTRNLLNQRAPSNSLNVWEAMRIWNPELPRIYRICSNITEAFRVIEDGMPPTLEPILGAPIQVGRQSAYLGMCI
jgi:DNA ligase-4